MSNSALSVPTRDDGNEQPRRRIPRKLLPRDVRIQERSCDQDLVEIEIDFPKKLLANIATRPRLAFSDIRPAALNHVLLGRALHGTKRVFRLSSPGGGLAYIKNGLPVRVTTAAQLAVILSDELVFEFIPAATAGALLGEFLFIFHPEYGDERYARLGQPPGQKQAKAVDRLAITLTD